MSAIAAGIIFMLAGDVFSSPMFPPFEAGMAMREENLNENDLREIEAGKTIVRSRPLPPGRKGTHVMAAAWVRGTVEEVFAVVVDCKGQPAYVPHLMSCTNTYAQSASEPAVIRYEQTEKLKFGFAFITKEVNYTIRMFEIRPYVRGWTLKSGDIQSTEGYFRVIPHKNGRQILLYDVYLNPGTVLPEWIQEILTQSDMPKTVEAYIKRVETAAPQLN